MTHVQLVPHGEADYGPTDVDPGGVRPHLLVRDLATDDA
jgi:hypothetical protein